MRLQVFMVMAFWFVILWVMMPCSHVGVLKVETIHFSKMLVNLLGYMEL
jgi:hypothetical protein